MTKESTARQSTPPASGVFERVRRLRHDDAVEVRSFFLDSGGVTNVRCYLGPYVTSGIRGGGGDGGGDGIDSDIRLENFSRVSRTLLRCGSDVASTLRHHYAIESVLRPEDRPRVRQIGEYGGVMLLSPSLERAWKNGVSIDRGNLETLVAVWNARLMPRIVALYERVLSEGRARLSAAVESYEQNGPAAVRLREFAERLK